MREFRTYGSVGGLGGQPPRSTRKPNGETEASLRRPRSLGTPLESSGSQVKGLGDRLGGRGWGSRCIGGRRDGRGFGGMNKSRDRSNDALIRLLACRGVCERIRQALRQ